MLAITIAHQNDSWKQIGQWLEQLGWQVLHVPSSVQARRVLELKPEIDLVLLDACSDEDSGLRLLAFIRTNPRLSRLPVIVVGTDISEEQAHRYIDLRVDNILLLPTVKDTFEAKVLRAVRNGKPTVLAVDDEEAIRNLLGDFLTMERYNPILAGSAEEAAEILRQKTVDVVVTDMILPGRSGLELLADIRKSYPHIPVVLITGYGGKAGPRETINMGADGYFAKPFHNAELIYTLRKVLSDRGRRPSEVPAAVTL